MPHWRTALLALACALPLSAAAQGPDTLLFGTTHERTSMAYAYGSEYLQQLCAEIHLRCQLQSLPGRRGAAMLADGSIVGDQKRLDALQPRVQPHDVQTVEACLKMVLSARTTPCWRRPSPPRSGGSMHMA